MKTKLDLLFPDGPYLDPSVFGIQGADAIMRHVAMSTLVSYLGRRTLTMIEVGSWIGASALTWGQAIDAFCPDKGSILCIDPLQPYFSPNDLARGSAYAEMNDVAASGLAYQLFCHNAKFTPPGVNLQHIRATFPQCEPFLQKEGFDLVYVDANHHYAPVLTDIQLAAGLLRPGGILCGDDLELQFHECDQVQARQNLTEDFVIDVRTGISYHPGVTCAVHDFFGGPVLVNSGTWAMQKNSAGNFAPPDIGDGVNAIVPLQFSEADRRRAMEKLGMRTAPPAPLAFY